MFHKSDESRLYAATAQGTAEPDTDTIPGETGYSYPILCARTGNVCKSGIMVCICSVIAM